MMRRIISAVTRSNRDRSPDSPAIERLRKELGQILDQDDDLALPAALGVIHTAARRVNQISLPKNTDQQVAQLYLDKLTESQRAMFFRLRNGETPSQIAEAMGVERDHVARTLAKIYSDLRMQIQP